MRYVLLGLEVDNLSMADVLDRNGRYRFIVPVNVDVLMKSRRDIEFRQLLRGRREMALLTLDSQVLLAAARLILGYFFKERVSGSDLVPELCKRCLQGGDRVFLLGGRDGAALEAMDHINRRVGAGVVVDALSPSMGFDEKKDECREIVERIGASGATVVAIGVGAPKQEKWMFRYADQLPNVRLFIAVGATIDFEAGRVPRAPKWMSNAGLEWFYRLCREPRRLAKRYFLENLPVFWLLLKQRLGLERWGNGL